MQSKSLNPRKMTNPESPVRFIKTVGTCRTSVKDACWDVALARKSLFEESFSAPVTGPSGLRWWDHGQCGFAGVGFPLVHIYYVLISTRGCKDRLSCSGREERYWRRSLCSSVSKTCFTPCGFWTHALLLDLPTSVGCVPHKIQEGQWCLAGDISLFQQATVGLGYLGMTSWKVLNCGRVHQKPVFEKEPRNTCPQIPSKYIREGMGHALWLSSFLFAQLVWSTAGQVLLFSPFYRMMRLRSVNVGWLPPTHDGHPWGELESQHFMSDALNLYVWVWGPRWTRHVLP